MVFGTLLQQQILIELYPIVIERVAIVMKNGLDSLGCPLFCSCMRFDYIENRIKCANHGLRQDKASLRDMGEEDKQGLLGFFEIINN